MRNKSEIKVLEAEWLYDNIQPMTVQIYKLNYDFFYDLDEGYNDEDEVEDLNEAGEQFLVFNNCPDFRNRNSFPLYTSLKLIEAKNHVEKTVKQKLNWISTS